MLRPLSTPLWQMDAVRVTGRLTQDARMVHSTGTEPTAWLFLAFKPDDAGLPYQARVSLGQDLADHMAAEALLCQLRTGEWVSVSGSGLELRTEHQQPVLRVREARNTYLVRHCTASINTSRPMPYPGSPATPEPPHAH